MANDLQESEFGHWWPLFTWVNILLVINAILGLAIFEWAWFKTRRFRKPIAELNAQFPELCRYDAPNWKKWKQYPGAVTLLIPRFIFSILCVIFIAIFLNLWLIGHNRVDSITGCRRMLCVGTVKLFCNLIGIVGLFTYLGNDRLTLEDVNYYEEYLGPIDQQKKYHQAETQMHEEVPLRGKGRSSTLVCNHIGFMEILNQICSPAHPSFTPKAPIKKIPFVGGIAVAMQAMFVERAGT